MNEIIEKEKINIEEMIYEIRGKQIMFSSDVAYLYNEETRRINEIVKRNINRFPNEFCFQLTEEEYESLRSQIAISNVKKNVGRGGIRYMPFVFTEYGIMMLSGLLKSDLAAEVNKSIIKAFIAMKKYISSNLIEQKYINNQVMKNTEDIKLLQESLKQLEEKRKVNTIFFEGQIYDAYSLMINLFNQSKNSIVIVDNYIDKNILDILSQTKKFIKIITGKINEKDVEKYKSQYKNIEIIINKTFHDRFIIIDEKIVYYSGASFKDLGKKTFAINLIQEEDFIKGLLNKIKKLT